MKSTLHAASSRALRAAVLLCALATGTAAAKDPALASLPMEHFRDSATITERPGEGAAVISTEQGFIEHTGPMRMVWHDEFLRAEVDRRTGRKTIEVAVWIIYPGAVRNYETAHYPTADGPRAVPVEQRGREVMNCAVGDCVVTEHVAFPVEESLLRAQASAPSPGQAAHWRFKLTAKSGPDYSGELSPAEMAGLLARLDEYLQRPAPVAESQAAARPDSRLGAAGRPLGIEGIPVEGSEEFPNRTGILVVKVERGSAAHRAGIIVGDILYECGGRPLRTPADLEAAHAGRAPASAVSVKLYRGVTDMTVSARP